MDRFQLFQMQLAIGERSKPGRRLRTTQINRKSDTLGQETAQFSNDGRFNGVICDAN